MHIDIEADRAMIGTTRGAVRKTWLQLLNEVLRLAGAEAELLRHSETPWASVTFSGSRHTIALSFHGVNAIEAGEAFVDALPEHEFTLPRHLVADASVKSVVHETVPAARLTVEAELLVLDEG